MYLPRPGLQAVSGDRLDDWGWVNQADDRALVRALTARDRREGLEHLLRFGVLRRTFLRRVLRRAKLCP